MGKESREFQIFAKPVGAACNLRCNYCYYLDKLDLHRGNRSSVMSDDLLERYIIQHIEASTEETISFSWHGGEPLMAGKETFRKIIAWQKKFKPEKRTIINGIQTNGTLIDKEWASFLSAENFAIGLSMDGPGNLHNMNRKTKDNKPTLHQALRGFEILRENGILCEILCVVHADNVRYPLVVYNFIRQLGVKYITFLPLIEKQPGTVSGVSRASVPSSDFGSFLSIIFDEWIEKDIGCIKIQIFEEAIRPAFNQAHTLCIFKEKCGGVPVVERNGDFYSCDHFVDKDHKIGNINDGNIADFIDSEKQIAFGEAKLKSLPRYCRECTVRSMCNGECPKNRFISAPDGEAGLNYLCSGYKTFFNHCRPFVAAIGSVWNG
jgi:uncharacterized protein